MSKAWLKTEFQKHPRGPDGQSLPPLWHASFACKVKLRSGEEWLKMKWGFNASLLIEEALDRARLFVESQYSTDLELNRRTGDYRTLALRCRVKPDEGLALAIMGKVCAGSESEAQEKAQVYCREICSVFPQDFVTIPAGLPETFQDVSGNGILQSSPDIAQIKRFERYLPASGGMQYVHGLWQSSPRSHEQIWRALAGLDYPALLSITLRPIAIYPFEQQIFEEIKKTRAVSEYDGKKFPVTYQNWIEAFVSRRVTPLKKYFYLQIHLASPNAIDENILRSIGTSLTREVSGQPAPGFMAVRPDRETQKDWAECLSRLDLTPSESSYDPRYLSDIADLEEAASVFRYPYPNPDTGIPGVTFETTPPPANSPNPQS
jgi:hypothetical protein